MTTTTAPPATDETTDPPSRWNQLVELARRVPLGWHAVAVGVVLLAAIPLINTGGIGMADEGAALLQAQIVHETGEWGITSPTAEIDPTGRWFPVPLSEEFHGRWYPYTKHTTYPEMLAVTFDYGGYPAVLTLQVMGVVAAALAGAFIARRVAPDHVHLTLWALALGTPLFFDGYWAIAHSLGCAGVAFAVVGLFRAREGHRVDGVALLVGGLAFSILMRSEATLFGLALAVAILVVGWRDHRRSAFILSAIAAATTVAGYLGSAELERIALGGSEVVPFRVEDARQGFIEGRFTGFYYSLLSPQLNGQAGAWLVSLLGGVACFVAWWYVRRRPQETSIITTAAVGACVAWMVRLFLPLRPLPGLLAVSPVILAGLISWRRSLRTHTRDLLMITVGLFSLAVIATQYGTGGTGDWGGRYFRLALPLAVPLALVAITAAATRVAPPVRRVLLVSLVGSCLALTLLAGMTLRRMHEVTSGRVDATAALARTTSSANDPAGPVIVTTRDEFGRFAWEHVLVNRYLAVSDPGELPEVATALADSGVDEFVFAGPGDEVATRLERVTPEGYEVTKRVTVPGVDWQLAVVTRTT